MSAEESDLFQTNTKIKAIHVINAGPLRLQ